MSEPTGGLATRPHAIRPQRPNPADPLLCWHGHVRLRGRVPLLRGNEALAFRLALTLYATRVGDEQVHSRDWRDACFSEHSRSGRDGHCVPEWEDERVMLGTAGDEASP